MNSIFRRVLNVAVSTLAGGAIYAAWCTAYFFIYCYILNPGNAEKWQSTGITFFAAAGFVVGAMIGCIAGLLRISRVNTALLACFTTSAYVLLLISDDLAQMTVPTFRTLAMASVFFHLIAGAIIGLVGFDLRQRSDPYRIRYKKRSSRDVISLSINSGSPNRLPKINFAREEEAAPEFESLAPEQAPQLMSVTLGVDGARVEAEARMTYRLIERFPARTELVAIHAALLPTGAVATSADGFTAPALPAFEGAAS